VRTHGARVGPLLRARGGASARCAALPPTGKRHRVALRHAAHDDATLAEVFYRHDYHPSEEVAEAIGQPRTLVDLGANIGLFGAFATRFWPGSTIVGYEADPENVEVHERTIAANRLGDRWRVVCAAAGARDGQVELAAGRAMGSFVVEPAPIPGSRRSAFPSAT